MRSPSAPSIEHDLVLVGGGHAHIQVLKRWAMAPVPGARLTVVVDRPIAVYSGMVPGFVAGQYSRDALEIDVRPLALRAGARCIVAAATGVDPTARRLILDGRPPITYDTVSFDVGSTVAGLEVPGAREHAIPTRPIGEFVRRVGEVLAAARGRESFRVAVVGAGAGGVEVVFALTARLRREPDRRVEVLLLEAGPRVLPGYAAAAARRVQAAAAARGITIRGGAAVARVEAGAVHLVGGERIGADATVWVTGAAALPIFSGSGLETDERGFVRIGPAAGQGRRLRRAPGARPRPQPDGARPRRAPPRVSPAARLPLPAQPGRRPRHRHQVGCGGRSNRALLVERLDRPPLRPP